MAGEAFRKVARKALYKPISARFRDCSDLSPKSAQKGEEKNRDESHGACLKEKGREVISNRPIVAGNYPAAGGLGRRAEGLGVALAARAKIWVRNRGSTIGEKHGDALRTRE